jgi:aspartate carbamoyltransferase catalytic subunit
MAQQAVEIEIKPRRHVLDLDDYTPAELDLTMKTTDTMREVLSRNVKKVSVLQGKSIVNLLYEPSTRTRVSFEQAGKMLSADVINLSPSTSSAVKGESLLNTARTLQSSHIDFFVIRHPCAGAPNLLAQFVSGSVINAGDGAHAHPTQALLDLYTLRQHLGNLSGKKIAIVGDILFSRVARSNLWGLTSAGAQVVLCGPPTLLPITWLKAGHLPGAMQSVTITPILEEALDQADAVMVLRLQHERQRAGLLPSFREYAKGYQINESRLRYAKPSTFVLHPGPMNEGVEIDSAVAHGQRSLVQEQVTNGVAVRMALLYLLAVGPVEL